MANLEFSRSLKSLGAKGVLEKLTLSVGLDQNKGEVTFFFKVRLILYVVNYHYFLVAADFITDSVNSYIIGKSW